MTSGVASYGALLDAVRGVRWPTRRRATGGTIGAHRSRLRGSSSEFSEFRPYRQGDDPRRVDWRLLARSDRAYVRLTTDRATMRTEIILDASASMAFPPMTLGRWVCAREVAIGLAAVAHAESDPVGLAIASDPAVRIPPRARRSVIAGMIRAAESVTPSGSPALAPLVSTSRASRLAIISDLLGDADALLAACRLFIAAGGEVVLLHLLTPEEMDPPAEARLAVDPENATLRRSLDADGRRAYAAALEAWLDRMRQEYRGAGVHYVRALSSEPPERIVRRVAAPDAPTDA
ncbi:MAG TPA: DUF58 domain-containing protein [Gemmatimonadaceae bacterium]|nr:DUF58 domain-containing protein [Gemmatimonadaceae bacterium]